jgi:hypothetical protein
VVVEEDNGILFFDIGDVVEDFDDVEKLGSGFVSMDEL